VAPVAHETRGVSPPGPRAPCGPHDQTSRMRLQLDFLRQLRLFEERPWHPNSLRVADSNDSRLDAHVITL